ncbi:hypothetical protein TRAPUB_5 [Trametes pubescens]|uniref:Uncharacterized protein n=1 Tax=Trametes pubescens TaxID=154538 RepID=A0A1M2VNB0_TRAPU|nr:hypothetical protein TRAPUB_5 [Trametes pubescens]
MPLQNTSTGTGASLAMSARSATIQSDVNLKSREALESFIALGRYNSNIGRVVQDLRITLSAQEGYEAQALRDVLRLTPNVECLVLDLPSEAPITLLNGLHFPKLRVLSTNLPHRVLISFIANHGSLTSLALRDCDSGPQAACPLRGQELRHLEDLQCPSRCFAGIARGPLVTATVNLTRLTSVANLAIQTLSASHLHTLTVDCFSTDYDILSRVSLAVPNLRKLKLIEKPQPHVCDVVFDPLTVSDQLSSADKAMLGGLGTTSDRGTKL